MTSSKQRIFIWVIAIVMAIGTLGAYFVVILANKNGQVPDAQQAALQKQIADMQKQQAACPAGPIDDQKISPAPTPPEAPIMADITSLSSKDITVGDGQELKSGDCVLVLFHGTLASTGAAFDGGDNYTAGVPYRSSQSGFVKGFSEGILGMKVGGERQIFIPSDAAYGAQAQGGIPANSDLVFSVKLVAITTQ